jgi:hypothetical protein
MAKDHTIKLMEAGEFDRLAIESTNVSQFWGQRLPENFMKSIHFVNICARNLDKERRYQFFTRKVMANIFDSFFSKGPMYERTPVKKNQLFKQEVVRENADWRDFELISVWVDRGLNKFIKELIKIDGSTNEQVKQRIDILEDAISICNDIVDKSKRYEIQSELDKGKKTLLFSWNEILKKDKKRFIEYVSNELGDPNLTVVKLVGKDDTNSEISFSYKTGLPEELESGTGKFILKRKNNNCELVTELQGKTTKHKIELFVYRKYDDDLFYSINSG